MRLLGLSTPLTDNDVFGVDATIKYCKCRYIGNTEMNNTATIGQQQTIDLVRQYKRIIARHLIEDPQVMLYGSYSKGTENKDSDIDVAVIVPSYGDCNLELSKSLWRNVDDVSLLIEPVLISKELPSPPPPIRRCDKNRDCRIAQIPLLFSN